MDELYNELDQFIRTLGLFNDSIAKTWDELQVAWNGVDALWTVQGDASRREFEGMWRELAFAIKVYREQGGERYEQFLMQRRRALDDYFQNR